MFFRRFIISSIAVISLIFTPLINVSCSAIWVQNEAQALEQLKQMAKSGMPISDSFLSGLESRFSNTRLAAFAKLLRAKNHLTASDGAGAAGILDTPLIQQKTTLGEYWLFLRGQALAQAGRNVESVAVFDQLLKEYPNSILFRSASLERAKVLKQNGEAERVASSLQNYLSKNDVDALLITAQAYTLANNLEQAIFYYRKLYFNSPASDAGKEAERFLTTNNVGTLAVNADDAITKAEKLLQSKKFPESITAFTEAFTNFPASNLPKNQFLYAQALAGARRTGDAALAFNSIPQSAGDLKIQAMVELGKMYANARLWAQAKQAAEDLRRSYPTNPVVPKTWMALGLIARDAKNKVDETYFLRTAIATYPNAVEVAQAQFELAWIEHDNKNFALSSQQLIEHLARYANKDTTYRGRAGYWSARDSERAGNIAAACALYEGLLARYEANWYGYLAKQRLDSLKSAGRCQKTTNAAPNQLVAQAVANLKTVTVMPEKTSPKELERLKKSEELTIIALDDWAIGEIEEASKTAPNSPKINLSLAKYYRAREDNTRALLALARSYPDYSQMKPEEMSREEWDVFYPLHSWDKIKYWATNRGLDSYVVAGLIRQESVFNTRAKSSANAFGLMQLLIPTARLVARKYGVDTSITAETLFQPDVNIQLGTGYFKDLLDKYGRVEYVAAAYNAGPNRLVSWRQTLPLEIDEFVESIPFRETKGYVQGVTRNTAQYRRLYDDNGNFKSNVGTRPLRGEIDTKPREQLAQEYPDIVIPEINETNAEE